MYKRNIKEKQGFCLICFKEILEEISITTLFSTNDLLCQSCLANFKEINRKENIIGVNTLFLYEYDSFFKSLIYQYKGSYDIALKDVFLYKHLNRLKRKYKKHVIVFPPSNESEDKKRGFIHIKEMVRCLKLPIYDLFYKTIEHKQSSLSFNERKKVENVIQIKFDNSLINKKILIVDDIYTSGSTLKTIIKLLINKGIKKENIEALIICKTKNNVEF